MLSYCVFVQAGPASVRPTEWCLAVAVEPAVCSPNWPPLPQAIGVPRISGFEAAGSVAVRGCHCSPRPGFGTAGSSV